MACTTSGIVIPSNLQGKSKTINAINSVANGRDVRLGIIYKSFEDGSLLEFIKNERPDVIQKSNLDTNGTLDLDTFEKLNGNTIKSIINNFVLSRSKSISDYAADTNGEIRRGFSTTIVLREAKQAVSNAIIDKWHANQLKPKSQQVKPADIIKEVISDFKGAVTATFNQVIADPNNVGANKAYNDKLAELTPLKEQYIKDKKAFEEAKAQLQSITDEAERAKRIEELQAENTRLSEAFKTLQQGGDDLFKIMLNTVNEYGVSYEKDLVNIYTQLTASNDFLQQVFYTPRIATIASKFDTVLESYDKVAEDSYDETDEFYEVEMDKSTARWNDNNDASFTDVLSDDIKVIFDSLYHLESPQPIIDHSTGKTSYQYSYTPNIKTKEPMGYRLVTAAIVSKGDFTSVKNLIDSISEIATSHNSLYGLQKLVEIMRNNPVIANNIYTNLSKPVVKKYIIDITDDGDFSIGISNERSDSSSSLFYDIINNVRNNNLSAYNYADGEFIDRMKAVNKSSAFRDEDIEAIKAIAKRYSADLDDDTLDNFINGDLDNIKQLVNFVHALHNVTSKFIEAREEFLKLRKSNPDLTLSKFFENRGKSDPYVDYVLPTKAFVTRIKNYVDVRVELNSPNAEGNLSSDTVNNAYILQFTNLVKAATSGDEQAKTVLTGMFANNPQFSHSPVLFGVKDENGNYISKGIFTKNADGSLTVNQDADSVLDVFLFDGVRNQSENNSSTYKGMSQADYFITQLVSFFKDVKVNGVSVANSSVYMVKTPSDAPKQYAIRGTRYNTEQMVTITPESVQQSFDELIREQLADRSYKEDDKNTVAALGVLATKKHIGLSSIKGEKMINNEHPSTDIKTIKDLITTGIRIDQKNELEFITYTGSSVVNSVSHTGSYYFVKTIVNYGEGNDQREVILRVRVSDGNLLTGEIFSYRSYRPEGHKDGNAFPTSQQLLHTLENGTFNIPSTGLINDSSFTKSLTPVINRETVRQSPAFIAIKQHIYSELNNMLFEINRIGVNENNLITIDNNSKAIIYTNYNKKGKIVDDKGNLTGQVFKFTKLFDINGESNNLFDLLFGNHKGFIVRGNGTITFNFTKPNPFMTTHKGIEINPASSQFVDEVISQEVEKFVERFIENTIRESSLYNDIIDDRFSHQEIIDFAINQYIVNMNLDSLFDGDSKFYKDAQTILKRLKQIQAGGKSHAGANKTDIPGQAITYTRNKPDGEADPYTYITVDGQTINTTQYIDGVKHKDMPMVQRNGFRAITISNTERPLSNVKQMYDNLKRIYLSEGLSEDVAHKLAHQTSFGGYSGNITADDAQSFITLDEFIRRKYADGTLGQYPGIHKLLDPDYELTPEDYENISKIQVQKNFYYDIYPDPRTGILIARQIKNSEFVLVPALLKGNDHMKDLSDLYDLMKSNDISQVNTAETSKATNTETFEFWKKDGTRSNNRIEPHFITDYYYKNLYQQQLVIDHMQDAHNKASIAFMKKPLDNPDKRVDTIRDRYVEAYTANIEDDFQTVLNNMGWKVNEKDGSIVNADGSTDLDYSMFYEKARAEAARMGLDSKFLEFLEPKQFDIGGKIVTRPVMPNFMADNSAKLESIAQSIFNKNILRQNLPGWHAPQVSSVGINTPVLDDKGNYRKLAYHPETSIAEISGSILVEDKTFIEWASKNNITMPAKDANDNYIYDDTNDIPVSAEVREAFQQYVDTLPEDSKPVYTEPYMEIMIPRWSGVIPEDATIEDLQAAGLDLQVNYRVPTEGKQSITKVKIVGFLDEMYGSVAVVPDGWVAQSGSDFDVDSIYAVVSEMYFNKKTNQLEKVRPVLTEEERQRYDNGDYTPTEEGSKKRYLQYVKSKLNLKRDTFATSKINKTEYKQLVEEYEAAYDEDNQYDATIEALIEHQKSTFDNYNPNLQKFIKINESRFNSSIKHLSSVDKYNARQNHIENLEDNFNKALDEAIAKGFKLTDTGLARFRQGIAEYAKMKRDINTLMNERYETKQQSVKENVSEAIKDFYQRQQDAIFALAEQKAREGGLKSFAEFSKYNVIEQQSKRARNNIILDSMMGILTHPSSRAENLARSNFDHVKEAMKLVADLRGESAKSRSAYSPFDQIEFMGNARSGASIKAISVSHDTHKSQANNMRAELHPDLAVYVVYTPEGTPEEVAARLEAISKSYGVPYTPGATSIKVPHTMYGWSLDQRNVVGELVTTYSSETTAHALDVIKEGNIFNVNDYTFVVFKVLSNLGIDFQTSITYMATPHMSKIVEMYNAGNSIYANSSGNELTNAIQSIVKPYVDYEYGYSTRNLDDAIKAVEDKHGLTTEGHINNALYHKLLNDIRTIIPGNIDKGTREKTIYNLNLNTNKVIIKLDTALKNNASEKTILSILSEIGITGQTAKEVLPTIKPVLDAISLHQMKHTSQLFQTARRVEKLARISGADKFGAEVSLYKTRLKIQDIYDAVDEDKNVRDTLIVRNEKGEYIDYTEALYPNVEKGIGAVDVSKALYRYQSKFLKSVTHTAVSVNSNLFEFDTFVSGVANDFELLVDKRLTDDEYKGFKAHVKHSIMSKNEFISDVVYVLPHGGLSTDISTLDDKSREILSEVNEQHRVFGYARYNSFNYTKEEVDEILRGNDENAKNQLLATYITLTPSQKINWIKSNFEDTGIFHYIKTRSDNKKDIKAKGYSRQTLSINDTTEDTETLYGLFRDAFYNKNPFIRLAALDIVKYHYNVDSGAMKRNGVGKVITNDVLLGSPEEFGIGLVDFSQNAIANMTHVDRDFYTRTYVRKNNNIVPKAKIVKYKEKGENGKDKEVDSNKLFDNAYRLAAKKPLTVSVKMLKDGVPSSKYIKITHKHTPIQVVPDSDEVIYGKPINVTNTYEIIDYVRAEPKENEEQGEIISVVMIPLNPLDAEENNEEPILSHNVKFPSRENYIQYHFNQVQFQKYQAPKIVYKDVDVTNVNAVDKPGLVSTISNTMPAKTVTGSFMMPTSFGVLDNNTTSKIISIEVDGERRVFKLDEKTVSNRGLLNTFYQRIEGFLKTNPNATNAEVKAYLEQNFNNGVSANNYSTIAPLLDTILSKRFNGNEISKINKYVYVTELDDNPDAVKLSVIPSNLVTLSDTFDDVIVAKRINAELRKTWNTNRYSEFLTDSISDLRRQAIDNYTHSSIELNKESIYKVGADLYKEEAELLLEEFNNFTTHDGEVYSLTDEALYQKISDNEQDANRVMYLITKMMKYGHEIESILEVDNDNLDPKIKDYIEEIANSINRVRNNKGLLQARNNIFNIYYAKLSNNPLVKAGLVDLTTIFEDSDWGSEMFSDISELNHKQIQTVVAEAYRRIEKVRHTDIPKEVAAFEAEWDRIMEMPGDIDMNKLDNDGNLAVVASDKFYEDRNAIYQAVNEAEQQFGKNSVEHIIARLNKEAFMIQNVHQPINVDYYIRKHNIEKQLVQQAGALYSRYLQLRDKLTSDERPISSLSETERLERIALQTELYRMRKGYTRDGSVNKNKLSRNSAEILDKALTELSKLNDEYFETSIDNTTRDKIDNYIKVIDKFHKDNPDATAEELFANEPDYAEAVDYLKGYTRIKPSPKTKEEYDKAKEILYDGGDDFDDTDKQIYLNAGAFDEYGNPDPSKLSQQDIERLRHKSNVGDRIIKPRTPVGEVVWDDAYYKSLANQTYPDVPEEEKKYIRQINEYMVKAIDSNGQFSYVKLKNAVGYEGLRELASIIEKYNSISALRKEAEAEYKAMMGGNPTPRTTDLKFNDEAYKYTVQEAEAYIKGLAGKNAGSSTDAELFNRIFGINVNIKKAKKNKTEASQSTGGSLFDDAGYNPLFFTYTVPHVSVSDLDKQYKEATEKRTIEGVPSNEELALLGNYNNKNEWLDAERQKRLEARINKAKTEAKKWIMENTQKTPSLAYYRAYEQARSLSDEEFKQWYDENHYFDNRSKKMMPLPMWTRTELVDNGSGNVKLEIVPTQGGARNIIPSKANPEYEKGTSNYNLSTGGYSDVSNLNAKERAMAEFLHKTAIKHAKTGRNSRKVERGFIPRIANRTPTTGDRIRGALSLVGLQWKQGGYNWSDNIGFEYDEDPTFNMLEIIKTSESLEAPDRPFRTDETDDEWDTIMKNYEAEVARVEAHNKRIDKAIRSKDFKEIYKEYIKQSLEYNAKRDARHGIYLLMEDLKQRQAFKGDRWSSRPVYDKAKSTSDRRVYVGTNQNSTRAVYENWAKRFLFDQYHSGSTVRKVADSIQNFTSAKFMVFNLSGGVKNVMTGMANVYAEVAAGQFLGHSEFAKAQGRYMAIAPKLLAYSYTDNELAGTLDEAFVKGFNIVDVEGFTGRTDDSDKFDKAIEKTRNYQYGLQSGGEHFMQNVMMLAMTESHKVFADENGKIIIGTESEYLQQQETTLLKRLVAGNPTTKVAYDIFIKGIKKDARRLYDIDTMKADVNLMFLKHYGNEALIETYIQEKKKLADNVKDEFKKLEDFKSQFELKGGKAVIKSNSKITDRHIADFINKVKSVNKKAHGVYDKLGAAMLEKYWLGSLAMQYHKHIYPGIMKRFRTKGYYNEHRGTYEYGSYAQLFNFLTTSWKDAVNDGKLTQDEADGMRYVTGVITGAKNLIKYMRINYSGAPEWQKANMRRVQGDMLALLVPIALKMLMNMVWEDDEIDDSIVLSNASYILQAHYQELFSQHIGIVDEANALSTRPFAFFQTAKDINKLISFIIDSMYDEEYDPIYRRGRFKGSNKIEQAFMSNVPGLRNYNKIVNMPNNNKFYKKGAAGNNMPDFDPNGENNDYFDNNDDSSTYYGVDENGNSIAE